MKRIHSFSSFSLLLEEAAPTPGSKAYDGTLNQVISGILNNYTSEVFYTVSPYPVEEEIKFVILASIERKVERFNEIIDNVNKKAKEENKDPEALKVLQAWVDAAKKAVESLGVLIEQYKGDPVELSYIDSVINSRLEKYLKDMKEEEEKKKREAASKAAATGSSTPQNSSFSWEEGDLVSEDVDFIFEGKRGMIDDIEAQISIVNSNLDSLSKNPGMTSEIARLQAEVNKISSRIGQIKAMRRRDIDEEELRKIAVRLSSIPGETDALSQKMLKQDTANKEVAVVFLDSIGLSAKARELEKDYLLKREESIKKKQEEEAKKKQEEEAKKIKVKITGEVKYNSSKVGEENEDVKSVQQLIIDKYGPVKEISDLPQYKSFSRFGADGKFGSKTKEMIEVIQSGMEMNPTGNITPELVNKIQTEDIVNESVRSIFKFKDFVFLNEAFKVKSAVSYAQSLPSYSGGGDSQVKYPTSPAPGSSSKTISSDEKVKDAEGSKFTKDLSIEEKWKWLLDTYSEGAKPGPYEVAGVMEDKYQGKTIYRINWKGYFYKDVFPVHTVCFKPEKEEELGTYREYIYSGKTLGKGNAFLIEEGYWGRKIDTTGKSSSGNWITTKEYSPSVESFSNIEETFDVMKGELERKGFKVEKSDYKGQPILRLTVPEGKGKPVQVMRKVEDKPIEKFYFTSDQIISLFGKGTIDVFSKFYNYVTQRGTWSLDKSKKSIGVNITSQPKSGYKKEKEKIVYYL